MIIFHGNDRFAYRDPACIFHGGTYYLFFTYSEKDGEYMYNRIGMSKSTDLKEWTDVRILTPRDYNLNYCSPGNIFPDGDEFVMCFTSYPMPYSFNKWHCADESARLFTVRTKDFEVFTEPELLNPKGDMPQEEIGRMIDPFIIREGEYWYIFFKQNGVSLSRSKDLKFWEFMGSAKAGENACVLKKDGEFILVHSPKNGIAFARSKDMKSWEQFSHTTLGKDKEEWAKRRVTAGFVMEAGENIGHKYIMFYHGSRDVYPETHGNSSLAIAFTDDFITFSDEL